MALIIQIILLTPIMLFAITIHEYSHGKAALSLGDPTAKNAGRITLNPISHLDPLGAICLLFFHFGWAKPVPVNVLYFKNKQRDIIIMALSGPVSNISAAFVAGLFLRYYDLNIFLYQFLLGYMIVLNVGLGLFNLLPIPPLDGSLVLENILPTWLREKYLKYTKYAPYLLIGIVLADNFLHTGIIDSVLGTPIKIVVNFIGGKEILK